MGNRFLQAVLKYRWLVVIITLIVTFSTAFFIPRMKIDTDPENMLSSGEPVRVFHNEVKRRFALWDMIVLGIVDESSPDGVFRPETLGKIYRITKSITAIPGVIVQDVLAPSTVDDIIQAGPGSVRFRYLMQKPPETREEALHIRDRALANPLFRDTLVSSDGKALVIYVPIEEKKIAHRVGTEIEKIIAKEAGGTESYHLTGLPIAEDTFGYEMFYQMRVSAPMAGVVIFVLLWMFFRNLTLILAPMLVAVLTVIVTMGLLVACGFTVHIMSSMIPIFLMPISVADSVHLLSMFFDLYGRYRDRKKTLEAVMSELFVPMLYTSITTMVGFASLTLTPIPPIRVFGAFVALGVGVAWVLTVTLIPAYVMIFLPERRIKAFKRHDSGRESNIFNRILIFLGRWIPGHAKVVLGVSTVIFIWSCIGISRIVINDNPVKWFARSHPIRIADEVLNEHFGGTYEAYLVLDMPYGREEFTHTLSRIKAFLNSSRKEEAGRILEFLKELEGELDELEKKHASTANIAGLLKEFKDLALRLDEKLPADLTDEEWNVWDSVMQKIEDERSSLELAKSPEILRYLEKLQASVVAHPKVGKINALTDIVKKVHQELFEGRKDMAIIPDSRAAVAQCLFSYQGSHDPEDLWHFVTPDYRSLNLWFQLKRGIIGIWNPYAGPLRTSFRTILLLYL
ncbi:efflux RND transporter permease subunit [Thermodesulforhabdus norvegica]|uniref:SSD domain-containing protein n=1 Tax=Thermodesulforhabdus norvegica TaxID=39841 RepID=A0A1I4SNX0_9BACT|nr:MMPL family transporter [Thermodesulforhabdus norvegica]SFM66115.1 hypothetical protein SAMN05660836_01077 [Thermodesulforhabdus norvegica]